MQVKILSLLPLAHRLKCATHQVFRVNSATLWYNRNKEGIKMTIKELKEIIAHHPDDIYDEFASDTMSVFSARVENGTLNE